MGFERILKMYEEKLYFNTLEDVKRFVNLAMLKNYELDLISGKYTVNAKSIMGIFSLDLTKPCLLRANTNDENELNTLKNEIAEFVYKEETND